jgi:hypothetical protein
MQGPVEKLEKHLTYNQKLTVFNPKLEGVNFLPGGLGCKANLSTITFKKKNSKINQSPEKFCDRRLKKPLEFVSAPIMNYKFDYVRNKSLNLDPIPNIEKSSWFYLNHKGSFVKFSPVINDYLENHFFEFNKLKKYKKTLNFNMNGDRYRLKFNKTGKKLRLLLLCWIQIEVPIYRIFDNKSEFEQVKKNEIWFWNNDDNVYVNFKWFENDLLSFYFQAYEKDPDNNNTFHIRLSSGKSYEINFPEMSQKNLETKYHRGITRIVRG